MQHIRTGVLFGVLGGLFTFLFGGWSVAVLGVLAGVGLGLALESKLEHGSPITKAKEALPVALAAGVLLVVLSLFQNFVVQPATGKFTSLNSIVVPANIIGFIAMVGIAMLTASFRGLEEKNERIAKMVLLAVIAIAFPFIDSFTGLRWTSNVIFALIFVILGLGLNIVVGYAGLLDLGYAAFFAIGAYTTGILSSPQHDIFLNFWLVIWLAAGVAAIWGLILGAPTLPLRGDYLAIVTLGFGEIIPVIFKNLIDVSINEPLTCWIIPGIQRLFGATDTVACINLVNHMDLTAGEKGINPIGRPILFGYEFQSNNTTPWYFLIAFIILLSVFFIRRLHKSRLGRAWMAIREDELAAAQMGIDPVRTKLAAFSMGATFSGFAGAFYAAYIRGIFPSVFDFSASIIILCVVILGGIGNINGVIVGGLVIMTADRLFLPALKDFLKGLMDFTILPALASNPGLQAAVSQNANPILYRFLLFGLTLVIMMAVRPEGLIPSAQMRAVLHKDEDIAVASNDEKAKKGWEITMKFFDAHAVTMTFGGLTAVNKVDFNIEKGMIASLIGPNGAGKTTFFNTITRVYSPTSGDMSFDGHDLSGLKPFHVTALGIARTFQNIRLFANMTAIENILVGQHCRMKSNLIGQILHTPATMKEEAEGRARGLDMLEYVGLKRSDAEVTAKNLSYGLQRRLEIARALASNPKLLLLDEPTAGMNPNETIDLTNFIQRLRKELDLTILLIEHHMRVVMAISDRVTVLDYGEKIAEGTPSEVQKNERVIEAYLGKGTSHK